ncbi:MAG: family 1 glycosylhydrolase [Chryseolinea sp.]
MDINSRQQKLELWGGVECTINRVGDKFRDQLLETGYYKRDGDLLLLSSLNVNALRYPILWERHQPDQKREINWEFADGQLSSLRDLGIMPIAGLLHHGSGPTFTNLLDDKFPEKFSAYAKQVAERFPWIEYYTPVNEPLTTARFSCLYGYWYPHHADDYSFAKALLNQLKGVVLAMKAIRQINPKAKLIQTEDLSKIHSTGILKYQARFENERRWLSFDLLCGRVNRAHRMWKYLTDAGITKEELGFFIVNKCPPDILGLNYYVTSERFLDHHTERYPNVTPGGNGIHSYVDVEAARTGHSQGLEILLQEAWNRLQIPMAITEAHLACTREEQMRWFKEIWDAACRCNEQGIPVKAVTAWALFGARDWNSLLTREAGHYESGAFDIRGPIRRTALAKMMTVLGSRGQFEHPLLEDKGWWHQGIQRKVQTTQRKPLLIIGKNGTLATAFSRLCKERGIFHLAMSRHELDITNESEVREIIGKIDPWGIVNASGFVDVDEAEYEMSACFSLNAFGPAILAGACRQFGIRFMTFSSDQVFSGSKKRPYKEDDRVDPLNYYGHSKAKAEELISIAYPSTLIIRTSALFGPWDNFNFAHDVLNALQHRAPLSVVSDIIVSPTYIPHFVHTALDLFIDGEESIWHLSNEGGMLSWAEFAQELAKRGGYNADKLIILSADEMNWKAKRPLYSVLQSGKGVRLPTLDHAIEDFYNQMVMHSSS